MYQSDVYFKLNKRQQVYSLPSLISAWNVKSNFMHVYDNTQSLDRHLHSNMFCLIKVSEGSGYIELTDQCFYIKKDQFLLVNYNDVFRYYTKETWEYYWYNFHSAFSPQICGRIYNSPKTEEDDRWFYTTIGSYLSSKDENSSLLADLYFAIYLQKQIQFCSTQDNFAYASQLADLEKHISNNYTKRISLQSFAKKYGLTDRYLRDLFKKRYQLSPKQYQQNIRMYAAVNILQTTGLSISEIAATLGYDTQFQFSRDFKKKFGVSPQNYRK